MDGAGIPSLEVGFLIDTGDSFGELAQLQRVMESTEAKMVSEAKAIERATGGMLNLGGATAQMTAFGNAATRELANTERATARAEKAGEALSRQMERQASTFGMTRAAAAALAAEQNGLTELAARLRSQEAGLFAMREQAAAATRREAEAVQRAAASHAELAAKVQASHAAQVADADAAERLRLATDPLYAATKRLNAEIAESTRLYHAGATAPAEYARQQEVLTGRLQEAQRQFAVTGQGMGGVRASGKLAGHEMTNLAYQFQDLGVQMAMAAQSSAPLKMAFMALLQQGSQISMIMSQAGVGIKGVAAAFLTMSKSMLVAAATNPYLLAFAAAAGAAAFAVRALNKSANESADMKAYAASLGLTAKEIRQLDGVTVTYGDTIKAVFQVAGRAIWGAIGPSVTAAWDIMKDWVSWIFTGVKGALNFLIGGFVVGYNVVTKTWRMLPGAMADLFFSTVNLGIAAINSLIERSVSGVNGLIEKANGILSKAGLQLPQISAPKLAPLDNAYKGQARELGKAVGREVQKGMGVDYLGSLGSGFRKDVRAQAIKNAQERIKAQAQGKGYLDPEKGDRPDKPKVDRHAEQLARENDAIEAQIRNLYALADAYGVSGAAALIAEARVKAESDAIKKRGDIELFVNRQVRLAIAQRVSDAAKATAAVREQTEAQQQVNAMVAAGLIPAEKAAELVKDKIADLPLLAAIEAAQQRGLADEAARATKELEAQRKAREGANAAAAQAKVLAETASGKDQLERLRLEGRLIGATNEARARAVALLAAEQFLKANPGASAEQAAEYRRTMVDVALQTERNGTAQNNYNASLAHTGTLLAAIGEQAGALGNVLSSAFGNFGSNVGQLLSTITDLHTQQQAIADWKSEEVRKAGGDATRLAQIEALAAKKSQTAQMQATSAAISGVKSLFKEKSTAFKIMSSIEKAYAVWQAAETVASIVRDASKTASHLANSATRTTANTAEGGSKIFAELGPYAFPVVAAMVAVLAALGARGGGGASGGPKIPTAEDLQAGAGTGTVLGDTKAKSESISRSLELVAANTNSDLQYSNEMLKALRSIDTSIARMAGTVARQVQVSGGMFDTSSQKIGTTGNKGFLGLFGSSTTRSLYDLGMTLQSGSVADIIANGVAGQTYQVIQKVKKKSGFLGIGGGTKTSYETSYGAIDGEITSAIQSVVLSLRNGLVSAADMIGLEGAEAILNGFQVNLGKLSFKDMTGEQIEDQLNAVFSSVGDQMASSLLPSLRSMQLVGEGLFETFIRVAKEYESVDVALTSIGRAFGAVGLQSIEARDALVQLHGGLEEFIDATNFFRDQFLSEAQQTAPMQLAVIAELGRLGMTALTTREQFRQAVIGLDLTTASGREMYASLMALAPAYDKVLDYQEQATKQTADGLKQTIDQFGKFAESLRKYREGLSLTTAAQGDAYAALKAKFDQTQALAASGDQKALGELEGAGKAFLDASMNNASTREQYLRDVALVARGVDAGIFAAESTADYAQLQLDAMKNAVSILTAIEGNAAAIKAALEADYGVVGSVITSPTAGRDAVADAPTGGVTPGSGPPGGNDASYEDLRLEIVDLKVSVAAGLAQIANYTGRTAQKLDDVTAESGGNALAMANFL